MRWIKSITEVLHNTCKCIKCNTYSAEGGEVPHDLAASRRFRPRQPVFQDLERILDGEVVLIGGILQVRTA